MKKYLLPLIIVILFGKTNTSISQDYFPLQVGNVWYYWAEPTYITEKVVIDNIEYYKYFWGRHYLFYYRTDDSGKVYEKMSNGEEKLVFDFGAEVGYSKLNEGYWYFRGIIESKTDTVVIPNGTFYNCIRVYTGGNIVWYAPGIGRIKSIYLHNGNESYLFKAKVNGRSFPDEPILPEVIRTNPIAGLCDVPTDANIYIDFNHTVKLDSMISRNLKVVSKKKGLLPVKLTNGIFISKHYLVITPDNPFEYNDMITVTVSGDVEDYIGDKMKESYQFTFVTEKDIIEPSYFLKDSMNDFSQLVETEHDWGDYDNDGDLDLLVFGDPHVYGVGPFIEIYENHYGEFNKIETNFKLLRPESGVGRGCIKWVDYNNDNQLDVVYAGRDSLFQTITLFYKNNNGSFEVDINNKLDFGEASMDWYDYNSDGFPDLAISGYVKNKSTFCRAIYKNENGILIKEEINDLTLHGLGKLFWYNYDNDKNKDLLFIGRQLYQCQIFKGINDSFNEQQINISEQNWIPSKYGIDYADIDTDGDTDILIGSFLLRNQNDSYILTSGQIDNLRGVFGSFTDFDKDGDMDLYLSGNKGDVVNRDRTFIQIYENENGEFYLKKEINFNKYLYIFSGKWVDLNKDGKVDLILATDEGLQIYYNNLHSTDLVDIESVKTEKILLNVFPNPFNNSTKINFFMPDDGDLLIKIYNIKGQEIKTLSDSYKNRGLYSFRWNGLNNLGQSVSTGLYLITLRSNNFVETRKILLIR